MPSALFLRLLVVILLACLSFALCDTTRRTLQSESRVTHVSGGSHSSVSGHGTARSGSVAFSSNFGGGQSSVDTSFLGSFLNNLRPRVEPETSDEALTFEGSDSDGATDTVETSPDPDVADIRYAQYSGSRSRVRGHGWSSSHAQTQNTGARTSAGPPFGRAAAFAGITPSGHKRRGAFELGHAHASYYFNPWSHWGK